MPDGVHTEVKSSPLSCFPSFVPRQSQRCVSWFLFYFHIYQKVRQNPSPSNSLLILDLSPLSKSFCTSLPPPPASTSRRLMPLVPPLTYHLTRPKIPSLNNPPYPKSLHPDLRHYSLPSPSLLAPATILPATVSVFLSHHQTSILLNTPQPTLLAPKHLYHPSPLRPIP
jgi:hypothetical protein